jgi:hypothetical protein
MPLYTANPGAAGLLPDQYGPLVVQPTLEASVFARVATLARTAATEYRIPIVAATRPRAGSPKARRSPRAIRPCRSWS